MSGGSDGEPLVADSNPTRWGRFGAWGSARADDAVALVAAGVLLLLVPDTGLLAERLATVGIGLDVVDFVGLVVLAIGLVLSVAAGVARLVGAVGRIRR